MVKKYLFIFDDGTVNQTSLAPDLEDLYNVEEGILDVIRWNADKDQFEFVDGKGDWNEVEYT